jgi:acetoin utilization deacetylase AcuC-like enzyme
VQGSQRSRGYKKDISTQSGRYPHQGNGTASVFRGWPWASILDLYEEDIFPTGKEPEDYPVPLRAGMTGVEYLAIVRKSVPEALDAVRPDLVIDNAGSDPFVDALLARLHAAAIEGILTRLDRG